jgi:hypothetical protein
MSNKTRVLLRVHYNWTFDHWAIFLEDTGAVPVIGKCYTTEQILKDLGKPDEYGAIIRTKQFGDKLLSAAEKYVKRKGGYVDRTVNCFAELVK